MSSAQKVIVIGGHGKVARLLTPLLVAEGVAVAAVIRAEQQADDVVRDGATAVVADIETMDVEEMARLVAGYDVIVWSAGAGGGNPERTYRVDRDAAILTMQAALIAGVRRFVMVSWSGSRIDHSIPSGASFYPYAQAKAIADAVLRDSALDWTIVAPGALTDDAPTGRVAEATTPGAVSRADVAALVARVVVDGSGVHETFRFNNGDTPIAEYLER